MVDLEVLNKVIFCISGAVRRGSHGRAAVPNIPVIGGTAIASYSYPGSDLMSKVTGWFVVVLAPHSRLRRQY